METLAMRKVGTILFAASALFVTGCTNDLYNPTNPTPEETPGDETIFDFSTNKNYTLNVAYDVPSGYQVYFRVYTENPLLEGDGGQLSLRTDISPIDVGVTDEDGYYSHVIHKVPTSVDRLYIYTDYPGVPNLMVADVTESETITAVELTAETVGTKAFTKAGTNYSDLFDNSFPFTFHLLGGWTNGNNYYGRPDYLLAKTDTATSAVLNAIRTAVPEGKSLSNNSNLLKNGSINVVNEAAEIWFYLIDGSTGANSLLAYFCYETANEPKSVNDIKNRVGLIFPNAQLSSSYYQALNRGEGVQLHYIDKDGVDQGTEFPVGTSVGWIICNNAYRNAAANGGKITANANSKGSVNLYYSLSQLNASKKKHVATFRYDEYIVLAVEDWGGSDSDWDYNDILFHVKSNPISSIIENIPEVKPDTEKPIVPDNLAVKGTLAFEDLWPYQGDFDMNDVVVRYDSEITMNSNNKITKTVDTYTLTWSGATFHDDVYYMLDGMKTSDVAISFSGDASGTQVTQDDKGVIVSLFKDALATTGENTKESTVVVTTEYTTPVSKDAFVPAPYNPYITTVAPDKEVHLTNMKPTSQANKGYFAAGDDESQYGKGVYYVTHLRDANGDFTTQQMPFAIDLADVTDFVIAKENSRIDEYYPKFLNWVNTKGAEDTDWYKHPVKTAE